MRFLVALWLTLAALPAFAQCAGPSFLDRLSPAQSARLDAAVARVPFAQGLAFEAVRGDDRLFLVGTIHIHDARLMALRDRIAPEIAGADVLLVEASPEDAAALQSHLASNPDLMFLPDGPTLPELLTEDTWTALSDAARARQIPPFMAAKMQPWFLSLSLAVAPCAMADMMAGREGLDFLLMDSAEADGVPIRSLEPWSLVIDLMREGTLDEQIAGLEMGLLPSDVSSELFVAMMEEYLAGRAARVWEASRIALDFVPGLDPAEAEALFDEMEAKLLDRRNRDWMPVIAETMAQADRAVIAVGAAHLPGEVGVLRLLEAEGWTITPVF